MAVDADVLESVGGVPGLEATRQPVGDDGVDLPGRQREALILRYYADLSEAEIAAAMGISKGSVKSHTARGMMALRAALENF